LVDVHLLPLDARLVLGLALALAVGHLGFPGFGFEGLDHTRGRRQRLRVYLPVEDGKVLFRPRLLTA
jgi:hypothetical protein